MPYREKRHVETAAAGNYVIVDHSRAVRRKRGIAGEEAGKVISIKKIHIGGASPPVYPVPVAFVARFGGTHFHPAIFDYLSGTERYGVEPQPDKPSGYRRRGYDRGPASDSLEGLERKVIGMGVSDENRVDFWKRMKRYSGWADTRQEPAQGGIEVGVGEKGLTA